jgi:hypothetical protein
LVEILVAALMRSVAPPPISDLLMASLILAKQLNSIWLEPGELEGLGDAIAYPSEVVVFLVPPLEVSLTFGTRVVWAKKVL